MSAKIHFDQPGYYRIRVQGILEERWQDFFDGLQISHPEAPQGCPVTVLQGWLPDQAALQGELQKLYSLGLPLISVETIPEENEK
ncbi:MAG: hypothetical protein GYA17_15650 [Chloroflexi bacterium]|jgi:hypothetical protein|nr:hypothetical protein [Anaerolineaceae bacterium]NMB89794.1 hypothetical protein [Chloroflexota bacterium]